MLTRPYALPGSDLNRWAQNVELDEFATVRALLQPGRVALGVSSLVARSSCAPAVDGNTSARGCAYCLTMPTDAHHSNLFILAMDHRDSLQKNLYGIDGEPTAREIAHIAAGKELIFDGLLQAIALGVDSSTVGVLVDERYGAAVARRARDAHITLAMPIERSGRTFFTLEYGTLATGDWLTHLDDFDPEQTKVLIRDNPAFDGAARARQLHDLEAVSRTLQNAGRPLLLELLVPATPAQLAAVDGDTLRYDRDVRPGLTQQIITDMQFHGIAPAIWKIEGLETRQAAVDVLAAAQAGGRAGVSCIILGRDAAADRINRWLHVAAGVPGFRGFAIGRSIWEQPLIDLLAGRTTEADLVDRVATTFTHFVDQYLAAG